MQAGAEQLRLPVGSNEAQNMEFAPSEQQRRMEDPSPANSMAQLTPASGRRSTLKTKKHLTPQEMEHHQWAIEHWVRMDRDHDGYLSRSELDSEEFRRALRSCLGAARKSLMGGSMGSEYSRTKLNIDQAIDFVRRKADNNADSTLTFEEFESFTRSIRYGNAKSNAELVFALFDLDGDGAIDQGEFREIYRYYLGRMPFEKDFQQEWSSLDMYGMQEVPKSVYIKWLQNSQNPIFKRLAPAANGNVTADMSPCTKTATMFPFDDMRTPKEMRKLDATTPAAPKRRRDPVLKMDSAQMQLQTKMDQQYGGGFLEKMDRPEWNRRHHLGSWDNIGKPQDQREYFSRPQSLPELTRFYDTHRGFERHSKRMKSPEPRRKPKILSQDTKDNPVPERDIVGGKMYCSKTGKVEHWREFWQDPAWKTSKVSPGTLWLRLPGDPTHLYMDLY